jgi:hypothetical protein
MNDNTPEHVAYKLFEHIASVEKRDLLPPASQGKTIADREWILQTYADCLKCVRSPQTVSARKAAPPR